jgi:AcrR family transcriptional regulator
MNANTIIKKESQHYHHGDLKTAVLKKSAEIISTQGLEALSLRAVARDLEVSHSAPNRHFKSKSDLLSALVADIWNKMRDAVLQYAERIESDDPHVQLNALGRGFLSWALENPAEFKALSHPDLIFYADDTVRASKLAFNTMIETAVKAAQDDGRHPETNLAILTLFTTSVPFGCATLLINAFTGNERPIEVPAGSDRVEDRENLIAELINLVVPI